MQNRSTKSGVCDEIKWGEKREEPTTGRKGVSSSGRWSSSGWAGRAGQGRGVQVGVVTESSTSLRSGYNLVQIFLCTSD